MVASRAEAGDAIATVPTHRLARQVDLI